VSVAGGEREGYSCSGIRGSRLKPGVPPAPGLANALRTVFSGRPCRRGAPCAGAVETQGLDPDTDHLLPLQVLARSRTLFFDHRFMRVQTACQLLKRSGRPPARSAGLPGNRQKVVLERTVGTFANWYQLAKNPGIPKPLPNHVLRTLHREWA